MDTVFNKNVVDHMKAPMYLGDAMGLARYETVKHPVIDKLTEKQLSFFWRPEEVDLSKDMIDFSRLTEAEQYVFTQNLKYQSLLDSVQGRAPNLTFLPMVSDIALETWITTWSFSETIHSRSYTHIMRNLYVNPTEVFDRIMLDEKIMKRATAVTQYYDDLIREKRTYDMLCCQVFPAGLQVQQLTKVKEALYLAKHAVNALEAIRFYVSFACTFSFAERGLMEGNAKIMKLIARDEQLHLKGTQYQIRTWQNGEDDPEMVDIAKRLESKAVQIFLDAAEQEKEWARDLLSRVSIPSLSLQSMLDYIDYLTASRMQSAGLPIPEELNVPSKHPLPWIRKWLNSESVQVAAQEAELSSYLVGQVDPTLDAEFFEELEV
ncbi:NrdB aerobic NDP reductase small subunit [Aeromonas phage phiAS5]|uniref:ribonucleoside-diphosphate reductase n=1 Tax=Aeromonas phage phiAS5 TaxID=879630 RepID=E1A2R8_9CAUD|nr:ribonucleoside diphosphate reductase small subunit [Aeromonas phage phiAS5]ADM80014.1 NrdB aerobic NDP reductase small subunit [Aeromonas phage phiAS5]BES53215.1 ribonucleotide-diphosphate reductase subunit beta [Aeromonas phage phiWae14]